MTYYWDKDQIGMGSPSLYLWHTTIRP